MWRWSLGFRCWSRRVFGLCDPWDGVGTFDQPSRPGAVGLESRGAHGEGSAAGAFRVLKLLGLSTFTAWIFWLRLVIPWVGRGNLTCPFWVSGYVALDFLPFAV